MTMTKSTRRPAAKTKAKPAERKPARKPAAKETQPKPDQNPPSMMPPPAASTPEAKLTRPTEFDFDMKGPAIKAAIALYHNAMKAIREGVRQGIVDTYGQINDANALLRFFGVLAITNVRDDRLVVDYHREGALIATAPAEVTLASWMME